MLAALLLHKILAFGIINNMTEISYIFIGILIAVMLVFSFILLRAAFFKSKEYKNKPLAFNKPLEEALLNIIAVDTSTGVDVKRVRDVLHSQFPIVFGKVKSLDDSVMFYKSEGKSESNILLLFHIDTARFETAMWRELPLGRLKEDKIFGRGALDDKGALCAALFALQEDIKSNVYIYISTDEESNGAEYEQVLKVIEREGINIDFIVDEGGFIAEGDLVNIPSRAALVGGVKRYEAVFSANDKIYYEAQRLVKNAKLKNPLYLEQAKALLPYCEFAQKAVYGICVNPLKRLLIKNALPCAADGAYCERLHNGFSISTADKKTLLGIIKRIKKKANRFADDIEVAFKESIGMRRKEADDKLKFAIAEAFGDMPVVEFLTHGATLGNYFLNIAPVLRFSPIILEQSALSSMHAHDEFIKRENLAQAVIFYKALFN